jgi:hypothetical protein
MYEDMNTTNSIINNSGSDMQPLNLSGNYQVDRSEQASHGLFKTTISNSIRICNDIKLRPI